VAYTMDGKVVASNSHRACCKVALRQRNLMLHWVSSGRWVASRGYEVWQSDDSGLSWSKRGTLRTGWANWVSRYPFAAQVGRLGVQNLICLSSGTLLGVADGVLYRCAENAGFVPVFSEFRGRRPLRSGICQDHLGQIYLAEYWLNQERGAVRLWKSNDDGMSWSPVYTWPAGTIRHIHFVQFDPYEETVWVGTGDDDSECQIAYSRDGGASFEAIGSGSQIWRAVSVLFTPQAVYWGTDIELYSDDQPNYVVRWERSSNRLQKVLRTDGPAYYSAQTQDALVVGTAVEVPWNRESKYVHLYWSKDHRVWHSARLWRKWPLPGVCGPATITFPSSPGPLPCLLLNANLVLSRHNGSLFEVSF